MQSKRRMRGQKRAFTLLEVLMVIVILGILAAVIAPQLMGAQDGAKKDLAELVVTNGFNGSLDRYQLDMGTYPEQITELIEQPDDEELADDWNGPYIKESDLKDPWGSEWYYQYPGEENASSYDLGSNGPNKGWGDDDDIVNWQDN